MGQKLPSQHLSLLIKTTFVLYSLEHSVIFWSSFRLMIVFMCWNTADAISNSYHNPVAYIKTYKCKHLLFKLSGRPELCHTKIVKIELLQLSHGRLSFFEVSVIWSNSSVSLIKVHACKTEFACTKDRAPEYWYFNHLQKKITRLQLT